VQVVNYGGNASEIWWGKQGKGLARFDNLSVVDLDGAFVERGASRSSAPCAGAC
jgi:uncharacterized protein YaeQ